MATLTGQSIASSYEQLLHVDTDGGGNTTTLVPIKDGDNGTTFAAQLSTTTICIDNPTTSSSSQGGILRLQSDDGAALGDTHRLGVIEFGAAEDGSNTITTGARIEAIADAAWSASENGADMVFYTTDGDASQTEVMRLTGSDSRVGIGITAPDSPLVVVGDVKFLSSTGDEARVFFDVGAGGNPGKIFVYDATPTEKIRLDSSGESYFNGGNVGINEASPAHKLEVGGDIGVAGNYLLEEQGRQDHVANTMPAPYYRFDGSNDYIDLDAHMSDFASDTVGTICLWAKTTATGSQNIMFSASDDGDPSSDLTIAKNVSEKLWIFLRNDGVNSLSFTSTASLEQDTWYHIVFTVGSSSNAIYVNGVLSAGTYDTGDNTTQKWFNDIDGLDTLRIGIREDNGGNQYPFEGEISDVKLYNLALTATEVKELYSGASVPFKYKGANQTDLVSSAFTNGAGATAYDTFGSASADGFTATVTGGAGDYRIPSVDEVVLVAGKKYRVSLTATITSGESPAIGIRESYTSGNYASSSVNLPTLSAGSNSIEFVSDYSGTFQVFIRNTANTNITVADFNLVQIGAVAEYDGSGITNDKWFDKSGNELHGTVSGATDENTAGAPVISENHPAFLVHPTSSQDDIGTEDIVFGTEIFDQGSNFSSTTFTAPVTGKYLFTWGIRLGALDTAANYYNISLVTSNRSHDQMPILDPGGFSGDLNYISLTGSILTDMDISDTAKLVIEQSAGTAQTDITAESRFSGYLVC